MTALLPMVLIVLALVMPLVGIAACRSARLRPWALTLAPMPLLALALIGEGALAVTPVLLGVSWAVDAVNRPLLLLAGLGWALAGAYAATRVRERPAQFALFWLLTLAGQTLALLAADLASFYGGYLLMTLAAYGLVVHSGSAAAWRAGRVYLVLALAGEALVLTGVLLLAGRWGNIGFAELAQLGGGAIGPAAWLLFAGFAVKLGMMPLHVWLPLAHPVAPVPASAVLSGILVKAGLLGMLRLLPAGSLAWPELLLALGLCSAVFGAVLGLSQSRLKTVLAYSTISQMGLLLAAFAALHRAGAEAVLPILGLLALHHGLNKTALFLAAGGQVGASRWRRALFVLPALALVGVPLLSGALAKTLLKSGLDSADWAGFSGWLIVSSVLTAVLMLHAGRLAFAERPESGAVPVPVHPAWPLSVLLGGLVPWLWAWWIGLPLQPLYGWFDALWPAVLAVVLVLVWRRWTPRWRFVIPEGDVLVPVQGVVLALSAGLARALDAWRTVRPDLPLLWPDGSRLARIENRLLRLPAAGGLMLLLVLAIALVMRGL